MRDFGRVNNFFSHSELQKSLNQQKKDKKKGKESTEIEQEEEESEEQKEQNKRDGKEEQEFNEVAIVTEQVFSLFIQKS